MYRFYFLNVVTVLTKILMIFWAAQQLKNWKSYTVIQAPTNPKLCSHTDPILIAQALQDYYPGDCRFIPIRQGQLVYVYAMLKDRGNLFWAGSVSKEE